MARVKGGVVSRKRRKRILKLAKGYYGAKHILFRTCLLYTSPSPRDRG